MPGGLSDSEINRLVSFEFGPIEAEVEEVKPANDDVEYIDPTWPFTEEEEQEILRRSREMRRAQIFHRPFLSFDGMNALIDSFNRRYRDMGQSSVPANFTPVPPMRRERKLRRPLIVVAVIAVVVGVIGIVIAVNSASAAARREAERVAEPLVTLTAAGVDFNMIKVDGGAFLMGCDKGCKWATDNEKPAHFVRLDTYYIGETEVTQKLWESVMGSNPSVRCGDNLPVVCISKEDCEDFVRKLSKMTGHTFRLPTEAEWEFAAMGGVRSEGYKYSGSYTVYEVGWVSPKSTGKSHDIRTKKPNELGIYDMSGNVWEWCSDTFGEYDDDDEENPTGAWRGDCDVIRGGAYDRSAKEAPVKLRSYVPHGTRTLSLGMRLVMEL